MENYQYQAGTEKPVKVGDDLVDPLRYVISYIDDNEITYSKPIIITGMDDSFDD